MTQYHGGKQRIGKYIADAIASISKKYKIDGYLEPFCGMLGVYQHIPNLLDVPTYIASDINKSVILMWKKAQKGWIPPVKFTKKEFNLLKGNGKSSALKGFVGHVCAHRGIYFAPYTSKSNLAYSSQRIVKIASSLKEVQFYHCDYSVHSRLKNYVIYCDPPYFKSSRYSYEDGSINKFDYKKFYKWAESMAKHNLVFISENSELPYQLVAKFGDEKLYLI